MTARSILSLGGRRKESTSRSASKSGSPSSASSAASPRSAPHPIPAGAEGRACPISGLFADGEVVHADEASKAQLLALQADPDIAEEIRALKVSPALIPAEARIPVRKPVQLVKFNAYDGSHRANSATRQLVQEVGYPALVRFTT